MSGQKERMAEVQRRVIDVLARVAPPGSRRIDAHCVATVAVNDMALSVLTEDGKIVTPEAMPPELTEALLELRRAHYLTEQGTWFSARFMLEPGSPIRPIYNYDFDPNWDPPIAVDAWRRDQIVMPRDGAHMPEWLKDRLEDREPVYRPPTEIEALNPIEQMEILSNEFSILVGDQAPALWDTVFGYYQVIGDHAEFPAAMVQRADKTMLTWPMPPAAKAILDRLRAGTYGFQGSTWSRIDYRVAYEEGTVRVQAKFTNDDEPAWNSEPWAQDVRLELALFPNHGERDWMKRRLQVAGPAPAGSVPPAPATIVEPAAQVGGVRKARVFDQVEPDGGRPSVSRPAVPDGEVARLVEYLRRAPIVKAARSSAPDQLDTSRGDRVPLTFHSDGSWVWAGAVAYYLEEHGVPPEPDLVAHIRSRGFQVPDLDDDTLDVASTAVTGRPAPERVNTLALPMGELSEPSALESRLNELGVPTSAYRIGEIADGAWSMLAEGGRWTVFLSENGARAEQVAFDNERQASAYLLGCLLLGPEPSEPSGASQEQAPETPIEPLAGEPPLTLFRSRKILEVPAGTTVDRYGGEGGNVTYAVRTPFGERSLPPDWANRPYQAYRLRRPLRALTGVAVPWFDQPGGGTAYLFERSIADLLADGSLIPVHDA
ncbi:TNT domain-containing protein [Actinomadura sp. 9N407]|uniref:TNT domain-containing protein n=1 Tax=Actinomadura sp. 9N407 TaxID=3375154 RepID=UPI0037BC840A